MPSVVITTYAGDLMKVAFANPLAVLPVQRDAKATGQWLRWGRRRFQAGDMPIGGVLAQTEIEQGVYDQYHPRLVHLGITGFLMWSSPLGNQTFMLSRNNFVQGVVLSSPDEMPRVYIVTMRPVKFHDYRYWPVIIWQPFGAGVTLPQSCDVSERLVKNSP